MIIPFGFLAILIRAGLFAWIYDGLFARAGGSWLARGLRHAATGGLLSWSFATLTVAAKNLMASVPDYLLIETAFTAVQWLIVGPLTALAFAAVARSGSASAHPA